MEYYISMTMTINVEDLGNKPIDDEKIIDIIVYKGKLLHIMKEYLPTLSTYVLNVRKSEATKKKELFDFTFVFEGDCKEKVAILKRRPNVWEYLLEPSDFYK